MPGADHMVKVFEIWHFNAAYSAFVGAFTRYAKWRFKEVFWILSNLFHFYYIGIKKYYYQHDGASGIACVIIINIIIIIIRNSDSMRIISMIKPGLLVVFVSDSQ